MRVRLKKKAGFVLVIDPGLAGSGFAVWSVKHFNSVGAYYPWKHWVKTLPSTEKSLQTIKHVMLSYKSTKVFCEGQAFMQAGKGLVTAKSGDLVKLCNFA